MVERAGCGEDRFGVFARGVGRSITADGADAQLEVTCKTSETEYKKHFLGLSDNVTYFVVQTTPAQVGVYNYRVIFKPQTVIPDVDVEVGR